MAKDDCLFLSGAELSDQIRRVCDADAVDCAVAFWGRDMRDALFPRWGKQKVRIVCDIAMGGTPRAALKQLDAPDNADLTVRDGLHAKVFVSSVGAVICSANASANGIGHKAGQAGKLVEAGVFCPAGSKGFEHARDFFAAQFSAAKQVSKSDLARAASSSHELHLATSDEDLAGKSLFRRLRDCPDRFEDISIAIADDDVDDDVAKAGLKSYNADHDQKRTLANVLLQTHPGDVKYVRRTVLLIYKRPEDREGKVWGYVDAVPYPNKAPYIVVGTRNWPSFRKLVGQRDLEATLSPKEWKVIGKLLKKDEWLFTPERFSEVLHDEKAG